MKNVLAKTPARPVLATVLAAALAVSPLAATPAQAGNQDPVGTIAVGSLLALLTAGLIISSTTRDTHHGYDPRHGGWHPGGGTSHGGGWRPGGGTTHGDGHGGYGHGGGNRPHSDPRKALPAQCAFSVRYGADRGSYYASRCLSRNFTYARSLPTRCKERVDRPGRRDVTAYDARCLARYGYRRDETPRGAHR